jgi:hypothetical protein
MNADDETNITDIELLPDGRVYVFGASAEVLIVLDELQGGADAEIRQRLHSHCGAIRNSRKADAAILGTKHARPD